MKRMKEYIVSMPAVGQVVRELIRCRDCKNAVVYDDNEVVCTHIDSNGNDTHSVDWFCADGKRRDEDD